MKPPKPELQNTRILRLAKQFVLLPFLLPAAVYGLLKGLLQRFQLKSAKELHADDQLRQSRVRRQLRGLPPDHVPESPKPL
jgi:cell division protein FtsX